MKKYSSRNYGKGFRRCKRFDPYIERWKANFRLYDRPYNGINRLFECMNRSDA